MYDPTLDRTDWRSRYDHELIAAAKESNHELAIALGERLDDLQDLLDDTDKLEQAERTIDELRRSILDLREELEATEMALQDACAVIKG